MKAAIKIENLTKEYQVGASQDASYRTLRESLSNAASRSWGRLRRFREAGLNGATPGTRFWALDDVSFEVQPGEVMGIIGRNGAGKSTLLKILSRITEPTRGRATIRGRVGSLLEVGTGFHPELTGRENIFMNGSILGMSRREIARKFDEIIDFAEIDQFLDTPVKRYSSGMYVRLAFAVAAHLEPEILLVDEVLAVGDAAFQKKCLGKMEDVAGGGRTVLFVSHNMPAVIQICHTAKLLDRGGIVAEGDARVVAQTYLSAGRAAQGEDVELSHVARPQSVGRRARIVSCRLSSANKTSAWALAYGTPLSLDVDAEVREPVEALELGIAVSTSAGWEVASPLSSDVISPQLLTPGRYRFMCVFPSLRLNVGRYFLGLGLRADRGMEDYLPEVLTLDVHPSYDSALANIQSRRGAVIPAFECTLSAC